MSIRQQRKETRQHTDKWDFPMSLSRAQRRAARRLNYAGSYKSDKGNIIYLAPGDVSTQHRGLQIRGGGSMKHH